MRWFLVSSLMVLALPRVAEACSCLQPDLIQQWHESTDMIGVRILDERVVGMERQFKARVINPFSGCLEGGDIVVLTTHRDSATCGASFALQGTYVVAANDAGRMVNGRPARGVTLCGWAEEYSAISADDMDFLMSRPITCNGALTCADGQAPTQCLVDPCTQASCVDGTCEANTCGGGCVAEFYDVDGYGVCEPW